MGAPTYVPREIEAIIGNMYREMEWATDRRELWSRVMTELQQHLHAKSGYRLVLIDMMWKAYLALFNTYWDPLVTVDLQPTELFPEVGFVFEWAEP